MILTFHFYPIPSTYPHRLISTLIRHRCFAGVIEGEVFQTSTREWALKDCRYDVRFDSTDELQCPKSKQE
jgi:hypothetical protein